MPPPSQSRQTGGMIYALVAFGTWGFLPFYLLLLRDVSALELVGWRAIFTLPVCLLFVGALGQGPELWRALTNPKTFFLLLLTATLIGNNWLLYVWSTLNGHVYAASLGYYINPLLNVVIGTIFLRERLSRGQWFAAGLATTGVAVLAAGALDTLGISLTLAISFASYGLIRKLIPVGALPGLTAESFLLLLPGVALIWFATHTAGTTALAIGTGHVILIMLSGVLTAAPLYSYSEAARRMDYSTLGFFQFLVPTIIFISGITVFDEELKPVQLVSFVFIWAAMAVFCWDLWQNRKNSGAGQSKASGET